ncbi:MAG: hypothetical protein CEO22_186 [Candidatus Berkelbacteria bacterium Gr01-1014_85]|uniref:Uncharacterized protein n=1 Tax=Candidatus Berkelbacteria bacterium Gr01-1014_85 TaxID=2017150 RepID=A0A554JCV1_9BACT|nr:MAG: hypothetical protein CEO22_186 [Candidatus Berkelbacteria bacterium Gr01-1014_85]
MKGYIRHRNNIVRPPYLLDIDVPGEGAAKHKTPYYTLVGGFL